MFLLLVGGDFLIFLFLMFLLLLFFFLVDNVINLIILVNFINMIIVFFGNLILEVVLVFLMLLFLFGLLNSNIMLLVLGVGIGMGGVIVFVCVGIFVFWYKSSKSCFGLDDFIYVVEWGLKGKYFFYGLNWWMWILFFLKIFGFSLMGFCMIFFFDV